MNRKNKNEGSLAAVFFSQRHTINLEEGTNEKRATGELVASRKRMHKTEQKVNWFDKTSKFALCPLFTVRPSFWPTFPFLAFAGFFFEQHQRQNHTKQTRIEEDHVLLHGTKI